MGPRLRELAPPARGSQEAGAMQPRAHLSTDPSIYFRSWCRQIDQFLKLVSYASFGSLPLSQKNIHEYMRRGQRTNSTKVLGHLRNRRKRPLSALLEDIEYHIKISLPNLCEIRSRV